MCGIAGIHFKNPSEGLKPEILDRLVNKLLLGIEPRGQDATGLVAVTEGGKQVVLHKADKDATTFIKTRPAIGGMDNIRTVLLHTRFATQGHQSNNANNHPVLYKTCFATHNGHINNDDALFAEFELRRNAEVDSEIIPALFSEFGLDKAHKALQELSGNLAVAVIDPVVSPDKLILAKGWGSPLIFHENDKFLIWASTLQAIKEAWGACLGTPPQAKRFWELQEGGLIFADGSDVELMQFKPKQRFTYVSSGNYGSYVSSNGSSYYGERPKNTALNCKSCGCTGFWHAGSDYMGSCLARPQVGAEQWNCRCEGFVYKDEDKPEEETLGTTLAHTGALDFSDVRECDVCMDDFMSWEGEAVWGEYWLCEGCLYKNDMIENDGTMRRKSCEHSDCGLVCKDRTCAYSSPETRGEEGDFRHDLAVTRQLALVSSNACTHESCDSDKCSVPAQVEIPETILGVKVFADEEDAEPGLWVPESGLDNETRHNIIMDSLAATSGFHKAFIEWILFEAPLNVGDNDEFLTNARDSLDEAYADKEMELNSMEADLYAKREMVVH